VLLAAHGNTAISQIKKRVIPRCRWTEGGCSQFAQCNTKRFCSKHYTSWLSIQAGGGGAPAINNDTVSPGEQAKDSNYYQQLIKLQSEEIKELKRKSYEQQQLQSRDGKIRILESNVQIMRQ
jgi:hypothetical protein